ncbi:MAG: HEAT repeat domain-containing protein [Planctomycetales bacterium]
MKPSESGPARVVRAAFLAALAIACGPVSIRAADPPPELEAGKVHLLLRGAAIGDSSQFGGEASRYFVARVEIVNRTGDPLTLHRKDVRLTADGQRLSDKPLPSQSRYQSIFVAGRPQSLSRIDRPERMEVPAGKSASMWATFRDVPRGASVPRMTLEFDFGPQQAQLDVNAASSKRLGLEVTRIGPLRSLGLLAISGEVDGVNAAEIAEALDQLVQQKVRRAVIRFAKESKPLPPDVLNWLEEALRNEARSESSYPQFPAITRALRELHLAQVPGLEGANARRRGRNSGWNGMVELPGRIHATEAEAIAAALADVYQSLPQEQLLAEIRGDDRLLRAAAISGGGSRLPPEALPLLLDATRGGDALLREAAVGALAHFGEAAATGRLVELAGDAEGKTAHSAIRALATSRFAVAHEALGELLDGSDAKSKARIVAVLAEHPRPRWAAPIFDCAAAGDPQLRLAAVKALVTIGHPRLLELLESMLSETDSRLREEAFRVLAERTDPDSEKLAVEHALARLEKSPPDPQIINLLHRTRDSRAVPLLLRQFENSAAARSTIINLLARVGDQSVEAFLIEKYSGLHPHEQAAALGALMQLRSTRLRPLAIDALAGDDGSLVSAGCQALIADGGPEAVAALVSAFEKSSHSTVWSYATNALAAIGTPECYAALDRGRKASNSNQRELANNALRNLRQRSPGYQYIWQAQQHLMEQNWDLGRRLFENAIRLDPNLPDAYVGRGTARLHLGQVEEARGDFEKAIELDGMHAGARTGMGLVFVFEDEPAKGVEYVERHRQDFREDAAFAYNAACVYARAAERLAQKQDDPAAAKQVAEYRDKALADLKQSVRHGFRDYEHIADDPDLKSLHDHPDFKKVITPGGFDN